MLLAGDIGGTNTRLALYDDQGKKAVREDALPSREFGSLEAAVRAFLGKRSPPRLKAAAFGIAGPVIDGRVKTTNLPWLVDERVVSRRLGIPRVRLVNDLVAIAFGASAASGRKLVRIQGEGARPKSGTVAVIAAGTGLGEAALVWDGARFVPCGSEGGHSDMAPRSLIEWELREFLAERVGGRVSYERVVSGPGLGNVYEFLRDRKGLAESAEHAAAIAQNLDPNRVISELGLSGDSALCRKAVELFVSLYGAEAGNLALKFLATGGVFVAGGIAASLLPLLQNGPFLEAFRDKGRFRPVLERLPVFVVLDSRIGLAGAARYAAMLSKAR
jgi:glucokinase